MHDYAWLCHLCSSRPARVIKPRRTEDPPRPTAGAARKSVAPVQQQKPARRDVGKPSVSGVSKKGSPSVAPSGPGSRSKGGKPVKVFRIYVMCIIVVNCTCVCIHKHMTSAQIHKCSQTHVRAHAHIHSYMHKHTFNPLTHGHEHQRTGFIKCKL